MSRECPRRVGDVVVGVFLPACFVCGFVFGAGSREEKRPDGILRRGMVRAVSVSESRGWKNVVRTRRRKMAERTALLYHRSCRSFQSPTEPSLDTSQPHHLPSSDLWHGEIFFGSGVEW